MPAKRVKFTPAIARRICDLISDGSSLDKIAALPGMPSRRTMCRWMEENPTFEHQYELARRQRTDALVDEAIEIADSVRGETENAAVQAARLAVDTRRWLASKLLPERFGDKAAVELTGAAGSPLIPPESDPRRLALALHEIVKDAAKGEKIIEHESGPVDPPPASLPAPSLPPEPMQRVFNPSNGQLVRTLLSGEDARDAGGLAGHAMRHADAVEQRQQRGNILTLDRGRRR